VTNADVMDVDMVDATDANMAESMEEDTSTNAVAELSRRS
jgi:hypothetical protein